jgi:hypothetical protein
VVVARLVLLLFDLRLYCGCSGAVPCGFQATLCVRFRIPPQMPSVI